MLQLNTKIANKLQWTPQTVPFYEVYELILHDHAAKISFWVQYLFQNTKNYGSQLEVQIAAWDQGQMKHHSHEFILSQHDVIHSDCFFSIENNALGLSDCRGDFLDKKASVHWNLHLLDNTIGRLNEIKKFYSKNTSSNWFIPTLCGRVEGSIILDLKKYQLKKGYFSQFHAFGKDVFQGKWLQALHFENEPSLKIYYFEKEKLSSLNPWGKKGILIIHYKGRIYTKFQNRFSKPLISIKHTDLELRFEESKTKLTLKAKVSHEPSSTPKAFDLTVELTTPGEKNRLTTQTLAGIGLQHRLF